MSMTAKQLFKNSMIELNKSRTEPLKLYEFNYYINKAISQYINTVYNSYDMNQQTTDDLRVLQGSIYLTPTKIGKSNQALVASTSKDGGQEAANSELSETGAQLNYLTSKYANLQSLYGAAYECWLPMDYLHILNCICTFEVMLPYDCYDAHTFIQKPATKITSDAWALVMDDIYNRPTHEKPYFAIYNQHRDTTNVLPMDPVTEINLKAGTGGKQEPTPGLAPTSGTDINGVYGVDTYDDDTLAEGETRGSNFKRTFTFANGHKESLVERTAAQRIGNPSNVRMEIRYGRDDTLFKLREVQVDYIKVPQYIRLTQEQLDLTQDVSQMLEWPDYICQEITNILVRLLQNRIGDPTMANTSQINQTIARPAPGSQQQQAAAPQAQ